MLAREKKKINLLHVDENDTSSAFEVKTQLKIYRLVDKIYEIQDEIIGKFMGKNLA
jgi:hypothetical protein